VKKYEITALTVVKKFFVFRWSISTGEGGQFAPVLGGQFKPEGVVILFRF
jgi:hypothetical protein